MSSPEVIDHEPITGMGDAVMEVAALYEMRDGKIAAAWFFSGG